MVVKLIVQRHSLIVQRYSPIKHSDIIDMRFTEPLGPGYLGDSNNQAFMGLLFCWGVAYWINITCSHVGDHRFFIKSFKIPGRINLKIYK